MHWWGQKAYSTVISLVELAQKTCGDILCCPSDHENPNLQNSRTGHQAYINATLEPEVAYAVQRVNRGVGAVGTDSGGGKGIGDSDEDGQTLNWLKCWAQASTHVNDANAIKSAHDHPCRPRSQLPHFPEAL